MQWADHLGAYPWRSHRRILTRGEKSDLLAFGRWLKHVEFQFRWAQRKNLVRKPKDVLIIDIVQPFLLLF